MSKKFLTSYSSFRRIFGSLLVGTVVLQSCNSYEFKTNMKDCSVNIGDENRDIEAVNRNPVSGVSKILCAIGGVLVGYMGCSIVGGYSRDTGNISSRLLGDNNSTVNCQSLLENYTVLRQDYIELLSYRDFVAPAYANCTGSLANMTSSYNQCSHDGKYPYAGGLYLSTLNLYNNCSNNGSIPNAYDKLTSLCSTPIQCIDGNTCGYGVLGIRSVSVCGLNGGCGHRLDDYGNICYNL